MTIHPSMTFTVTPPGGSPVDYTAKLAWSGADSTPTINQHFGRQGDTASFVLVDEYNTTPNFYIQDFSLVSFVDNTASQTLFAGVCNDPSLAVTGPNRNEWTLQCTDYTFYADNAVVHGVFTGITVDEIIVSLTTQANCGITAATVANGGFVSPGPQLASFILNYTTLSSAWRKLSQLASSVTPYGWYVDENRALHFFDASSAQSSGVTFTTTPTSSGDGSLTEGHISQSGSFSYEWDGTSLRNRILVQGANQTITFGTTAEDPPTDTWLGNSTQASWPLRFTPTGTPVLWVNNSETAFDTVEAGSSSTAEWQVAQNSVGSWFLTNTVAPPAFGVVIKLWYDYEVPIVAQANDFASQTAYTGPNGGVFTEYINDSSLTTVPMALARAQRERQEYAFSAERINFDTTEEFLGWVRAGQTCQIINQFVPDSQNSYSWGINDGFIVISNNVSFGTGGYRISSVTAIRVYTSTTTSGYGSGLYGAGGFGVT